MSDSDWDETSEEEQPNYLSAKQKFVQHMARIQKECIEKPKTPEVIIPDLPVPMFPTNLESKSKSAADLLDEFWIECYACGQKGLVGSNCSCGGIISGQTNTLSKPYDNEFRMWVENKMILSEASQDIPNDDADDGDNGEMGITLIQYVETEPSRMSWQQLAKVIPPQRIVDLDEEDESGESQESQDDTRDSQESQDYAPESDDDSSTVREYDVPAIQEFNHSSDEDEKLQSGSDHNNLMNDIQELRESRAIREENYDALVKEREFLIEQLQACEDRIEEVEMEINDIDEEIERLDQEYNETVVAEELIAELDEFSQAVQILLNASEFYDIKDLISAYARDGASNEDIKRQVILDAKLTKKQQLLGSVNTRALNPKPRNSDGLPNLHDSYLIDSYTV